MKNVWNRNSEQYTISATLILLLSVCTIAGYLTRAERNTILDPYAWDYDLILQIKFSLPIDAIIARFFFVLS